MRKAYAALIAVLVVVVIAFTFAKSYLSRLGASDMLLEYEVERRELIDSLHETHREMLQTDENLLRQELDSVRQESSALMYSLESQLDLYISRYDDDAPQDDSGTCFDQLDGNKHLSDGSAEPTLTLAQYEIYAAYLELIMRFPKDLSSYEKKVEIREVKRELMKRFSLSSQELEDILSKARERRVAVAPSG